MWFELPVRKAKVNFNLRLSSSLTRILNMPFSVAISAVSFLNTRKSAMVKALSDTIMCLFSTFKVCQGDEEINGQSVSIHQERL